MNRIVTKAEQNTEPAIDEAASIQVYEARDGDLPAIHAIYTHHVETGLGSFEETAPDAIEMAERRVQAQALGLPYLVARAGGRVLGFAYAAPYRTRSAYRHTVENSIYVAPDAQRRGAGGALLDALIARCTEQGYRQMIAVIGDSENAASIRLHERAGFVRAGTLRSVGRKFDTWVDSVLMQRALGDGDRTGPS